MTDLPTPPDESLRPSIGTDEWVERHDERLEETRFGRVVGRVPSAAWLAGFVALAALVPLLTSSQYVVRVGVDTIIFMLLALGLNVVVGWSGLLDLGYVAFFGFGAYLYAILSSDQFDIHWPAEVTVPLVVVACALLGLVLGLPSRRLLGDYLAIVTLFFLQIFITIVTNADRLEIPFVGHAVNFTGGPNGVPDVDSFDVFGYELDSVRQYFYLALGVFVIVIVALALLSDSRTGRAWRALREDPLAAELMSIPVNRLKLLAFSLGAGTAGLTGTIFAPLHTGVFPTDFDLPLLITIYAMVILGGAGSLAGVVLGAIVINVSLEALTDPEHARWLFYGVILVSLVAALRPWRRLAAVLGALVASGFVLHVIVDAASSRWTAGDGAGDDVVARAVDSWVLLPSDPKQIGNIAFVGLVAAVLALTLARGVWRLVGLVPVLYLAAFVWENRLAAEPSVTRLILLGALLVALMNARPQGLLGSARVEIV